MARADSQLFQPLTIGHGSVRLAHRVVLAPLTRNRGTPLNPEATLQNPNRVWLPNDLMKEHYVQRTTPGGLLISEAIPPSLEGNCMPGVPGLFDPLQVPGWKDIVSAVHAAGGVIYAQLWHSGRANVPQMTGTPIVAPSAVRWDSPTETFPYPDPATGEPVCIAEHPPIELTPDHIQATIKDYCDAARRAIHECGFDGVELHGGNGYLPEQFLSSNSNRREDAYGGTPEKRCRFVLELMQGLSEAVGGSHKLAVRLTPFGLYNQARSEQRLETWGHLCRELKREHPTLSYVSFIEPRYEQIFSEVEKESFLESWGVGRDVDLSLFREIWGETPFFSAGGFDDLNSWEAIDVKSGEKKGRYDALLYGRYFISNPDLVERLKKGLPLAPYDRSRFYGPFPDPEVRYTDYPTYEQEKQEGKSINGSNGTNGVNGANGTNGDSNGHV